MELRPVFVEVLPEFDEIKPGQIWISHKYRTVNLRCPCGCGDLTVLTLHPSRWHIHFDGKSITISGPTGGSVWAYSGCGSHYLIRNNEVRWLDRIEPHLHRQYADTERKRLIAHSSKRRISKTRWGQALHRLCENVKLRHLRRK